MIISRNFIDKIVHDKILNKSDRRFWILSLDKLLFSTFLSVCLKVINNSSVKGLVTKSKKYTR